MSLYDEARDGVYADPNYVKRMAWAGGLSDVASIFGGRGTQGMGPRMAQQAAADRNRHFMYKDQLQRQREQDARQAEMAEYQKAYLSSQVAKNFGGINQNGIDPIGSPQKLDNGNLGVVVQDPSGLRVVDTGTAFRDDPSLDEQFDYQTKMYNLKRQGHYQDVMHSSENAAISANTAKAALLRAQALINGGVETGTYSAAFVPEFWQDSKMQELVSLSNEAVLSESEKLKGVLSESDMKFLQESTISAKKKPAANLSILERKLQILRLAESEAQRKFNHFQSGGNYFDWVPYWNQNAGGTGGDGGGPTQQRPVDDLVKEAGF